MSEGPRLGIAGAVVASLLLILLFLLGIERGLDLGLLTRNPIARNAFLADNDELWHLATGRVIAETGHVPDRDPFTYTAGDTPWTNMAWLAQLVLWELYRVGGIQLDWTLATALWLGAVAFVHLRARRRVASNLAAIPASFYVLLVLRRASEVRPQGWTFLLLAAALYLADLVGTSRKRAALLVLLLVLSDQLHGGFVFIDVALAIVLVVRGVEKRPESRFLLGALAGGAAGFLLHPHGVAAFAFPFRYVFDARLSAPERFTTEHLPPDLRGIPGLLIEVPLFTILLAAATKSRKLTVEDALLTAAFGHLALQHARGVHTFAIVVAAPFASALDALIAEAKERAAWLGRAESWAGVFVRLAPAALALAVLGTAIGRAHGFAQGRPGDTSDPLLAPHADTADMASFVASLPPARRLFHSQEAGGVLIFKLYPERKVFVDGRSAELHALSGAFDDLKTVWRTDPGWEEILDRRGCDLVLVPHGLPLDRALRGRGWEAIRENASYALLARPSKH